MIGENQHPHERSTQTHKRTATVQSLTHSPIPYLPPAPTYLRHMNLQHCHYSSIQVVRLRCLGVVNVDGVPPAGYSEDGCKVEILGELLGVQRGTRDEELEVWAEAGNVLG